MLDIDRAIEETITQTGTLLRETPNSDREMADVGSTITEGTLNECHDVPVTVEQLLNFQLGQRNAMQGFLVQYLREFYPGVHAIASAIRGAHIRTVEGETLTVEKAHPANDELADYLCQKVAPDNETPVGDGHQLIRVVLMLIEIKRTDNIVGDIEVRPRQAA